MSKAERKPKIYLAGGFRSDWQRSVRDTLTNYEFLDPSKHGMDDAAAYTAWDLAAIDESDVLLAYLEETNPGGYALALEVGYAKALGKEVILVEEHPDESRRYYFTMVRQVADFTFRSLDAAIDHLARGIALRPVSSVLS